jgi:multidrug efflux system membrane fusion protein
MSANASSRRNSILLSAAVVVGLVLWVASGRFDGSDVEETTIEGDAAPMRVTVQHSQATSTTRTIVSSARTEPNRWIELKAETEGQVVAIGAERGASIAAGQPIVQLDMRDREAQLTEAEALIRQRELEYQAAEKLVEDQFISEAELAGRNALLVAARAARERIALDIERTRITAPFDSVVYDRLVEIGDYVAIGDAIAELVDVDPIVVVGDINERDIGALAVGSTGRARVLAGPEVEGRIRYLAPVADESTRSFRVELEIPNPDSSLKVGTSAELLLGAESITAHEVSSGLLTLADDGTVGVKIVEGGNRVRFVAVEIAEATGGRALVTGLPAEARIITVGQGFVVDGQIVTPVEESADLSQAADERPY